MVRDRAFDIFKRQSRDAQERHVDLARARRPRDRPCEVRRQRHGVVDVHAKAERRRVNLADEQREVHFRHGDIAAVDRALR